MISSESLVQILVVNNDHSQKCIMEKVPNMTLITKIGPYKNWNRVEPQSNSVLNKFQVMWKKRDICTYSDNKDIGI